MIWKIHKKSKKIIIKKNMWNCFRKLEVVGKTPSQILILEKRVLLSIEKAKLPTNFIIFKIGL